MDDMIAMITERRRGKSTRLLQMANTYGKSSHIFILTFNTHAAKQLMEHNICLLQGLDYKAGLTNMSVLIDNTTFKFLSLENFIKNKERFTIGLNNYEVYIDELPICLNNVLGDVKMFTGTCLKME